MQYFYYSVQKKLEDFINGNIKTEDFNTLELICLRYMLFTGDRRIWSEFPISDLHNVLEHYMSNDNDIKEHYDDIMILRNHIRDIMDKNKELNWLVNHCVSMDTKDEDNLIIHKRYEIMAYNPTNCMIFRIIPDINSLNNEDVKLDLKFDYLLMKNISINTENYKRFNNKKISFCIVSLNNPIIFIEPIISDENLVQMKKILFDLIIKHFEKYKEPIIDLLKYYRDCDKLSDCNELCRQIQTDLGKPDKRPRFLHDIIDDLIDEHDDDTLNDYRNNFDEWIESFNRIFNKKLNKIIKKER